ncbi:hypothetical protein [Rhodopila globiformis]|uniref:hypothetical protein n=1 Tax=Rhodopila globiformis TaxID=1071 RepID=UPI0011B0D9C0|nr:hypothetical protein [Rhodopila globiformis]
MIRRPHAYIRLRQTWRIGWRWLREDVTYHHCHATAEDLIHRVAAFEADVNHYSVADRLLVKDHLDPEEEKLRFSK